MLKINACVFSIEEFSIYDGPGIRTTVFLKGCPLRCSWCHNPEGQSPKPEILRSPNGCIECGNCLRTAQKKHNTVIFTEQSIQSCPHNLLRYSGEWFDSQTLCQKLLKNKPILQNGGGVTFSGGEPLMQGAFLSECLRILKGQLHTAIQTSGYASSAVFDEVLSLADHFLFDLKLIDESLHRKYTGVSCHNIHRNFARLVESGKDFTVRIPLIPGVTDTNDNITRIATLLQSRGVHYAELLPYNKMAGAKYKLAGREYLPDFDHTANSNPGSEIFHLFGIQTKIL